MLLQTWLPVVFLCVSIVGGELVAAITPSPAVVGMQKTPVTAICFATPLSSPAAEVVCNSSGSLKEDGSLLQAAFQTNSVNDCASICALNGKNCRALRWTISTTMCELFSKDLVVLGYNSSGGIEDEKYWDPKCFGCHNGAFTATVTVTTTKMSPCTQKSSSISSSSSRTSSKSSSTHIATAPAICKSANPPVGTEHVTNGDFSDGGYSSEVNPPGWNVSTVNGPSFGVVQTTDFYDPYAFNAKGTGGNQSLVLYQPLQLVVGQRYELAWFWTQAFVPKAPGLSLYSVSIGTDVLITDDAYDFVIYSTFGDTGVLFTATSTCENLIMTFYDNNVQNSFSFAEFTVFVY